jgi:hypothetical protein
MPIAGPTTEHAEIRHWADKHKAVPTEILPQTLDHEPTTLRIMLPQMVQARQNVRVLTWEEFFTKFDLLGLSFVYDDNSGGYNELLQIDAKSPYRSSRDQPIDPRN